MTKTNTINLYQWNAGGFTYETPSKETLEAFKKRKGFTTDEEVVESFESYSNVKYFIGTQTEYDTLITPNYVYVNEDGFAKQYMFQWLFHLKDGAKGDKPELKSMVPFPDKTVEITKTEYDVLFAKNNKDRLFSNKLSSLKSGSMPKLAAYIEKGEDYLTMHSGDVKESALKSFLGANGKVDEDSLDKVMVVTDDKVLAMNVIVQLFYHYSELIRTGTEDSLKGLPFDNPTDLNIRIDTVWKNEHDKDRKVLSTKLGVSLDLMNWTESFILTSVGDEPEVKE